MQKTLYHVFTRHGYDRTLQNPPEYKVGEYAVAVKIVIPDSVFQRRPVPVVEVILRSAELGTADVIVDGQKVPTAADAVAEKQAMVQEQFAELYKAARESSDQSMRGLADVALRSLLDAGVDVRIITETQGDSEEENTGA